MVCVVLYSSFWRLLELVEILLAEAPRDTKRETKCRRLMFGQDMGVEEDCMNTVKTAIEKLGGLDIIIANAV